MPRFEIIRRVVNLLAILVVLLVPIQAATGGNNRALPKRTVPAFRGCPSAPPIGSISKSPFGTVTDYAGWVESFDCGAITGWAADLGRPNVAIEVRIYDGATLVATGLADHWRHDLADYVGDNGFHAFAIDTPESLKDGASHIVRVCFETTDIQFGDSPRSLSCVSTPGYTGWIDSASCSAIEGWAADRHRPDVAINVRLYDGETLLMVAGANQPRPDLRDFLRDQGRHGFSITLPPTLKDSTPHALRLRFETSSADLTNSPQTIACSGTPGPIDAAPPAISAVSVSSLTANSAIVSWMTSEAGDSQIEYGTTGIDWTATPLDSTRSVSHSVSLSGLSPGTIYYYHMKSRDAAGNLAVSGDLSFTTQAPQPRGRGPVFYVAPEGSPTGDGTIDRPWDLQTALNQPSPVRPGSTIYLRGGTYVGKFVSDLTGSAVSPITVRSYPGEWAKIDGYVTGLLDGGIIASSTILTLKSGSQFDVNQEVLIDTEVLQLYRRRSSNTYTILRGRSGGVGATAHDAGATVVGTSDILTVNGASTIYRDFEVLSSEPTRVYDQTIDPSHLRGEGVNVFGPNVKLINLVIHDTREGIGFWDQSVNSEINGCIIFNNGLVKPDRSHGHGIYIQNQSGLKLIKDVISFNNFTTGMKAFGVQGLAENIRFEGVASFNNGSSSSFSGNPAGYSAFHRFSNLLIATQNNPMHNIAIVNNYLYSPSGTIPEFSNLGLGVDTAGNDGLIVAGNRVMGAVQAVSIFGWQNVQMTNNQFYATTLAGGGANEELVRVEAPGPSSGYTWNNNTYFDGTPTYSCNAGPSQRVGFNYPGAFSSCSKQSAGRLPYTDWKAGTPFDVASTYSVGRPTNTETFVRASQYEPGRANIIVFNWGSSDTVDVNVSGILQVGQAFEVRNVQDYFAPPVLSGAYSGAPLRLPLNGLTVAKPIGLNFTPQSTSPEFAVFVLIPR
jgi:hypothetical protein